MRAKEKVPDGWPEYKCVRCGDIFYTKFKDYELCFTCLGPIHEKIKERGNKYVEENKDKILTFRKNYVPKKKKGK